MRHSLAWLGDSTGRLVNGGTGVQSSFPSWLSPLGWGQQLYPFTQQRLWVFGLFAALIVAAVAVSLVLMTRRDVGMGIFPTKDGAPRAAASLSSAFGLARRLQGGVLRGWAVAVFILGVSYGLVINELQGFLTDNEELREVFLQFGDEPTEAFLGLLIAFMTITITGYAVQSMLRMRAEESAGHLEPLLATGVSRRRWVLSHVGFVALGVLLLTLLTALSMGVTYVVSTGTAWSELWDVFAAVFTQSAAIFAFMGFVMLLFGLLPNLAVPVAWGAFAGCFVVQQLGVLLDLPQWVFDLSPFAHLPAMPAEAFELAPLLALLAVAAALHLTGLAFFSRRDIQTK
ncbi:hypothetical protein CSA80_01645 [Candidatus Saccharibacteria bacterium]|nr:MAG: hypothetical protein CSA80_01645 [Candidatus Saccharibacteria bacterium]